MKISLANIGLKYSKEWVFRNLNLEFSLPSNYVVLGANGSGKSTLLKIIAGYLSPSEGNINYYQQEKTIARENIFGHLSIAAPYVDLIEEFSMEEMIKFHFNFKPVINSMKSDDIVEMTGLAVHRKKFIKDFSSGMLQRIKLAIAVLSDVPLILLDEPVTNLDNESIDWYKTLIKETIQNQLLIVFSNNNPDEYGSDFTSLEL